MKTIFRTLIVALAITGACLLATREFGIGFGTDDFWDRHGVLFLIAIAAFPRLTLLFSSVPFGGLLWWAGWFLAPRFLVAVLATLAYWNQNPILVTLAWLVAIGGESSEKVVMVNRVGPQMQKMSGARKGFESAKWVDSRIQK